MQALFKLNLMISYLFRLWQYPWKRYVIFTFTGMPQRIDPVLSNTLVDGIPVDPTLDSYAGEFTTYDAASSITVLDW
jgi:hypothetical protein